MSIGKLTVHQYTISTSILTLQQKWVLVTKHGEEILISLPKVKYWRGNILSLNRTFLVRKSKFSYLKCQFSQGNFICSPKVKSLAMKSIFLAYSVEFGNRTQSSSLIVAIIFWWRINFPCQNIQLAIKTKCHCQNIHLPRKMKFPCEK